LRVIHNFYEITLENKYEDPNEYRDRNLEVRDAYDEDENYEVIMNIVEEVY
jgi:hypothetical protein